MVIYNFEIERIFKNFNSNDLNDNFLGIYPFCKINKFIEFGRMMKGRKFFSCKHRPFGQGWNALVEHIRHRPKK